jgi:hypothetical protein
MSGDVENKKINYSNIFLRKKYFLKNTINK